MFRSDRSKKIENLHTLVQEYKAEENTPLLDLAADSQESEESRNAAKLGLLTEIAKNYAKYAKDHPSYFALETKDHKITNSPLNKQIMDILRFVEKYTNEINGNIGLYITNANKPSSFIEAAILQPTEVKKEAKEKPKSAAPSKLDGDMYRLYHDISSGMSIKKPPDPFQGKSVKSRIDNIVEDMKKFLQNNNSYSSSPPAKQQEIFNTLLAFCTLQDHHSFQLTSQGGHIHDEKGFNNFQQLYKNNVTRYIATVLPPDAQKKLADKRSESLKNLARHKELGDTLVAQSIRETTFSPSPTKLTHSASTPPGRQLPGIEAVHSSPSEGSLLRGATKQLLFPPSPSGTPSSESPSPPPSPDLSQASSASSPTPSSAASSASTSGASSASDPATPVDRARARSPTR